MKASAAIALAAIGIVIVLLAASALTTRLDPMARAEAQHEAQLRMARAETLAPLWIWLGRIGIGALGVALVALAASAIAGAVAAWAGAAKARNASALVYARQGLYPAVVQPPVSGNLLLSAGSPNIGLGAAPNEPRAQIVAALADGNLVRIPAGAMRPILRPEPETALLPEAVEAEPELLPAEQVVDVDPITRPHWLIVGQTGSGKSTATRYIMAQLAQQQPVEFLICEPGGVDWNDRASATSESGIAEAIDVTWQELERRQDLLRAADAPHIAELRERLPYLYIVIEEMEAILDNLRELSRSQAVAAKIALRNIARLGRKTGIGLIAITQAARTDVFDSHVRTNLANVLLFRNSQTTAEMFRVSGVRLVDLPTGTAYSVAHGGLIAFPRMPRPAVPISALYRESVRVAVAPQFVVGSDEPDGELSGIPVRGTVPVPQGEPEEWLLERIRQEYVASGRNLSAAQRAVFGYDGGRAYYVARMALGRRAV